MNTTDYVTFETAQLLKKAGYPQSDSERAYDADEFLNAQLDEIEGEGFAAPHLWDAMKWLREEKQVFIGIRRVWVSKSISYYMPTLCTLSFGKWLKRCGTYEEACDQGIKAACKWLINDCEGYQCP